MSRWTPHDQGPCYYNSCFKKCSVKIGSLARSGCISSVLECRYALFTCCFSQIISRSIYYVTWVLWSICVKCSSRPSLTPSYWTLSPCMKYVMFRRALSRKHRYLEWACFPTRAIIISDAQSRFRNWNRVFVVGQSSFTKHKYFLFRPKGPVFAWHHPGNVQVTWRKTVFLPTWFATSICISCIEKNHLALDNHILTYYFYTRYNCNIWQ